MKYSSLEQAEEAFEVRTSAIGAAQIPDLKEFLDGRVDFAEVTRLSWKVWTKLIYKKNRCCS